MTLIHILFLFSIYKPGYGVRGLAIIQICLSKHPSLPHLQFNAHARVRDFVVGFYLRVFVATMRTTECRKNNFPEVRNLSTKIIKSFLKFRDSEFIGRHIRNCWRRKAPNSLVLATTTKNDSMYIQSAPVLGRTPSGRSRHTLGIPVRPEMHIHLSVRTSHI